MKRQLPGMVDTAINLVPGAATVKVIAKFATKNAKSLYAGFKMTDMLLKNDEWKPLWDLLTTFAYSFQLPAVESTEPLLVNTPLHLKIALSIYYYSRFSTLDGMISRGERPGALASSLVFSGIDAGPAAAASASGGAETLSTAAEVGDSDGDGSVCSIELLRKVAEFVPMVYLQKGNPERPSAYPERELAWICQQRAQLLHPGWRVVLHRCEY